MLKLKNVSKFYYNNGVVSSGFTKVNLEFKIGEFVAITGESGSGKSTLLNVISGLDTYEEGEMYVNDEETSYYNENDFEEYRKKYIANIFQSFNLINSYTVYQNLELMFMLNNITENIDEKINKLLEVVNLTKFKNTMVSKLSGGQKQRVAIARALAKDTPIIVADEPTGNLDSKSAKEIIKLLYEISKGKLVIIVTHNYDQVEEYVTRKIKMSDGKVLEDVKLKNIDKYMYEEKQYGYISSLNKWKLAIRNTFNIIPKFLLLLVVYTFLCLTMIGQYTSTLKSNYDNSLFGYNAYFKNKDDKRILIQKEDLSYFTDEDYKKIESLGNINYIVKNDLLLDTELNLSDNKDLYIYGMSENINNLNEKLDLGRMPLNDNEIVIKASKYSYYINDDLYEKELKIGTSSGDLSGDRLKIVGIKYLDDDNYYDNTTIIYLNDNQIKNINKSINSEYSDIKLTLNNTLISYDNGFMDYNVKPNDKVETGKVIVPDALSYVCKDYNCENNNLKLETSNIYYKEKLDLKISKVFNKNDFEKITGLKNYDNYSNTIFMNYDEYYSMYDKEPYQSSVFVSDVKKVKNTINKLEENGYKTLYIKDTIVDFSEDLRVFANLFKLVGVVIVLVALFFISYFVIKIILKSRNIYYSTVRILGASKSDVKALINMELNVVLSISYLIIIVLSILVINNVLRFDYLKDLVTYLKFKDFIIIYIVLFSMSRLISNRYSKSLFKKSAMNTYREV